MAKQTINPIQKEKHILRKFIRDLRRAMPEEEKVRADALITQAVCALSEIQKAHVVSVYISLPDEVSTSSIRSFLLGLGKTIAVPKVEKGNLKFYTIIGDIDLEPGVFGLMEPKLTCPVVDTKEIEAFLVPGLAFDRTGNRLGRGKGYYDRALSTTKAIKIGLAYACQIVSEVPASQKDRSMDCIVTESEIIRVSP